MGAVALTHQQRNNATYALINLSLRLLSKVLVYFSR